MRQEGKVGGMVVVKRKGVAWYKRKADEAFSQYVRYRDSFEQNGERVADCITCGVVKPIAQMQNGHFVSRKSSSLRFDDTNCNVQCVGCNMFKYGDLYQYAKAIDLKYGDGTAEALHMRRNEMKKWTIPELEAIIADSKQYVKELQ